MNEVTDFITDIATWMGVAFAAVIGWFSWVKQKHAEITEDWDPKVRTVITIVVIVAAFLIAVTLLNKLQTL